jgi:hypothetical protein
MFRARGLATVLGACAALSATAAATGVVAAAPAARTAAAQSCTEPEIPGGPPTALPGTVDAATVEGFAVLRRDQQPSDLPPPLNPLAEQVEPTLASYYPVELRRIVALPDGRQYFLITGFLRAVAPTSVACLPPGAPPALRRLVEAEAQRVKLPVYCVGVVGEQRRSIPILLTEAGGGECEPFASIREGARVLETDSSTVPVADIVPDGVASVRLGYRDRIQITAAVHENGYVFTPPRVLVARWRRLLEHPPVKVGALLRKHLSRARRHHEEHVLEAFYLRAARLIAPTRIEWLAADGSVVRLIQPHPSATVPIPPPPPIAIPPLGPVVPGALSLATR